MNRANSRGVLWLCGAILLVPLFGIMFAPQLNAVWILAVLAVNTVVFFNLGSVAERGPESRMDRLLLLGFSALFAAMTIAWTIRLALRLYVSGSLGL